MTDEPAKKKKYTAKEWSEILLSFPGLSASEVRALLKIPEPKYPKKIHKLSDP